MKQNNSSQCIIWSDVYFVSGTCERKRDREWDKEQRIFFTEKNIIKHYDDWLVKHIKIFDIFCNVKKKFPFRWICAALKRAIETVCVYAALILQKDGKFTIQKNILAQLIKADRKICNHLCASFNGFFSSSSSSSFHWNVCWCSVLCT